MTILTATGPVALEHWGVTNYGASVAVFWAIGTTCSIALVIRRAYADLYAQTQGLPGSAQTSIRGHIRRNLFRTGTAEIQDYIEKKKADYEKRQNSKRAIERRVEKKHAKQRKQLEHAVAVLGNGVTDLGGSLVAVCRNSHQHGTGWSLRAVLRSLMKQIAAAYGGLDVCRVGLYFFEDGLGYLYSRTRARDESIDFDEEPLDVHQSLAGRALKAQRTLICPESSGGNADKEVGGLHYQLPDGWGWECCVPVPCLEGKEDSFYPAPRYGVLRVQVRRSEAVSAPAKRVTWANAAAIDLFLRISQSNAKSLAGEAKARGSRSA